MNQLDDTKEFDGIAIVGMAGRFPGADTTQKFWVNLCRGTEFVSTFTEDQLLSAGVEPRLLQQPNYVKAGVLLDAIEYFDADFFGFTPRDAELMDPQHRLFLECSWQALEDAGFDPQQGGNRIGVFAGAGMNNYFLLKIATDPKLLSSWSDLQKMLVIDKDYLATRVSYKLNLKGPSMTVQTGCSTSLVAIHLACQSLLNGECDMALAGGVSIRLPQVAGYLYEEGSIQSPDGHCRAFDADAQGMVPGSGAGVVVLKRMEDALADGACIRAVIRGSSVNNDGADKIGYTAPSIDAQASVIAEAHALAGVNAEDVTYIEAHGTGTRLGDPIEIAGLTKTFRRTTSKRGYCAIGSVKTNIGHLDAASGVAGLIKVVLALERRMLPPSLNFRKPNPNIDFENSPFFVQQALSEWRPANGIRVAGVSSFGIGGTNAHVVVEEAPQQSASTTTQPWQLLTISAKTSSALEKATVNLADFLEEHPEMNLSDVAFTLQTGRKPFDHRRSVVVQSLDDSVSVLRSQDPRRISTHTRSASDKTVVFMFPGQAAQCVHMGLEIYQTERVFRETVDYCCEVLKPFLDVDLLKVLYPPEDQAEDAEEKINQTAITQPAIFTIEYAMARLWMHWGLRAESMLGHSIGEYVAACLSGVFSLEDALSLVAERGRLMNSMPEGSMLATRADENEIRRYLNGDLSVAAVNGPSTCVVSGPTEAIAVLQRQLEAEKIGCRLLKTSHAFHSKMMEAAVEPFRKLFSHISVSAPKIPFISNVTGTWIAPEQAIDPDYWASHLRETVRFSDGLRTLLKNSQPILLEVGPGKTLTSFAKQHPSKATDQIVLSSFGYSREPSSDLASVLSTLCELWTAGAAVDWPTFHSERGGKRVPLPTYPFERLRYWLETTNVSPRAYTKADSDRSSTSNTLIDNSKDIPTKTEIGQSSRYDRPVLSNEYMAPRDELEKKLVDILQEMLGIRSIGREDDFFELGGHSLLAAGLFTEIEKRLGKKIPLATIFEAPTIRQLADVLRQGGWKGNWASLVAIQPNGSRPPLFLVHGAEGNVLLYRELAAHLGSEQPVYGLQSRGLDGTEDVPTSIEVMAACYVEEIRAHQVEGPYYLGGYCMGGIVALEMAQQLHAQSQEVGLVAMFETNNLTRNRKILSFPYKCVHQLQNVKFHLDNLWLSRSEGGLSFFKEKARVQKARIKVAARVWLSRIANGFKTDGAKAFPHIIVTKANDKAFFRYVPRMYPGRITVFCPSRNFAGLDHGHLGWKGMATGGVDVHILPVKPRGMLVEPFVRILAKELKSCMDEAGKKLG